METNQIKLLHSLAKKIKEEKKEKDKSLSTLCAAKILTKNGNFTGKFSNLNRVTSHSK